MEEILASIRRIISEDDKVLPKADVLNLSPAPQAPAPAPAAARVQEPEPPPAPEPEPVREMYIEPEPEEDVCASGFSEDDELIAVDFEEEPEAEPPPVAFRISEPPSAAPEADSLLGDREAGLAAGALNRLMGSMQVTPSQTLEGVVRDLLRPLLKQWLDEHLPLIVEAEVQKEIDRIRRLAR